PPSWQIARRLYDEGKAGILVPSFAPGATSGDHNIVLWRWSNRPPYRVSNCVLCCGIETSDCAEWCHRAGGG
ncbi:MAG: RES family NAD+ phosphorylase, partial [Acetobacteraceae bacterium]